MDETKQKVSKQFIDFLTTFRNREEINLFTIDEVITSVSVIQKVKSTALSFYIKIYS